MPTNYITARHLKAVVTQKHLVPLTLLCSIVLVGLTLPFPYVAINVIKIVSGNIGNAVELEEVGLCGQSPQQRQKAPHKHRGGGWSEALRARLRDASRGLSPIQLQLAAGLPCAGYFLIPPAAETVTVKLRLPERKRAALVTSSSADRRARAWIQTVRYVNALVKVSWTLMSGLEY